MRAQLNTQRRKNIITFEFRLWGSSIFFISLFLLSPSLSLWYLSRSLALSVRKSSGRWRAQRWSRTPEYLPGWGSASPTVSPSSVHHHHHHHHPSPPPFTLTHSWSHCRLQSGVCFRAWLATCQSGKNEPLRHGANLNSRELSRFWLFVLTLTLWYLVT